MFALPRILYSMASDGLLFKKLAVISKRTSTPVIATIVTGIAAGMMSILIQRIHNYNGTIPFLIF